MITIVLSSFCNMHFSPWYWWYLQRDFQRWYWLHSDTRSAKLHSRSSRIWGSIGLWFEYQPKEHSLFYLHLPGVWVSARWTEPGGIKPSSKARFVYADETIQRIVCSRICHEAQWRTRRGDGGSSGRNACTCVGILAVKLHIVEDHYWDDWLFLINLSLCD